MHTSGNYRQLGLIRGLLGAAYRFPKPLLLSVLVVLSVGVGGGVGCHDDRFAGDGSDGSGNMTMPPPPLGSSCNTDRECKAGRRCVAMRCVMDYGDCATDNDCQDDTYCGCPPRGPHRALRLPALVADPAAQGEPSIPPVAAPRLSPSSLKTPSSSASGRRSARRPRTRTCCPHRWSWTWTATARPRLCSRLATFTTGHLIALSGKDCSVKWDRPVNTSGCTHIAAADLDNDGKLEIIGFAPNLTVFDYQGNVLVSSGELGTALCARDYPPALANLDGAGPPEIVVGAAVFRYTPKPAPSLSRLWNYNLMEQGSWASIAVAQDLDGDGKPEVITGNKRL
jgi:hypothetical protein